MVANQQQRLISLQPYLKRIAHNLSHKYAGQSADDLLQAMNLAIVERAAKDPTFLDQADGYISQTAGWAARDYCCSHLKGVNHGWHREAFSLDEENPDGFDNDELFADEQPDLGLALDIRDIVATLTGKTRKVADLMMQGYTGLELAERAGLKSNQAVNYYRGLIRQALAPVYANL